MLRYTGLSTGTAPRKFRFTRQIGQDYLGKTYLAEQISPDGRVCSVTLELMSPGAPSQYQLDCIRSVSRLHHQHIAKIEAFTSIGGLSAIVMENLDGISLGEMDTFHRSRPLVFPRAALFEIAAAVVSALDDAYNGIPPGDKEPSRVLHRNLLSSQIFITVAGAVKVLGFRAPPVPSLYRAALPGLHMGHMSPERMLGEVDTPAGDIFSLGITLYELLASEDFGRVLVRQSKLDRKVEACVAALPLTGRADWMARVRDTLRSMLSYDPGQRPTAAQLTETMALLASEANDMGLQQYSRTLVAEALDALPPFDPNDVLCGTIADEDTNPDSDPLLHALLVAPKDDTIRLVYADWLEERGDDKASLLRAQVQGAALPDPQRSAQNPLWLAYIDRTTIENCQGLRFQFQCPKRWEDLTPSTERVRFCDACERQVYHCASVSEAQEHASQGHCVAINSFAPRRLGDLSSSAPEPLEMMGIMEPEPLRPSEPPRPAEPPKVSKLWWQFWRV